MTDETTDPRDAVEPHSVLDSTADDGRTTATQETTPATVQNLAKEAAGWFTTIERRDNETITVTKDGRPEWLTTLIRTAHGDMLPDDYRYSVISEALDAIADADAGADLDEVAAEFADDVDIYTHELTAWFGSRADRHGYVDEARDEFGSAENIMDDISRGQARERREVFDSVRASLEALADETDENA